MARAKRKTNTQPKPTTARATRARSKEVAAAPPAPIAASRRSTRATSNEPLLGVDQLEKLNKRKSRKTPEVQQQSQPPAVNESALEPPTPVIEEDEGDTGIEYMDTVEAVSPSPLEHKVVEHSISIATSSSPPPHNSPPSHSVEIIEEIVSVAESLPSGGSVKSDEDEEEQEFEEHDEQQSEADQQLGSSQTEDLTQSTETLPVPSSPPSQPDNQLTPMPHQFHNELSTIAEEATSEIALFFTPVSQNKNHVNNELPSPQQQRLEQLYNADYQIIRGRPLYQVFEYLQSMLDKSPADIDTAKRTVGLLGSLYKQQENSETEVVPSPRPPKTPITPTASIFHPPSENDKPKTAGLFSKFTSSLSALTTPVRGITGYLTGAKTQPVNKVAEPAFAKAPFTPTFDFSRPRSNNSQRGRLSPPLDNLIRDLIPDNSSSYHAQDTPKTNKKTQSKTQDDTPAREIFRPSADPGRSILYDKVGNKIPTEYRNWIGRRRVQQARDWETLLVLDAEAARGLRTLTAEEKKFKEETELKQTWLDMWRARQPGNVNKTPQVAGKKRTIGAFVSSDSVEDSSSPNPVDEERSAKRARTSMPTMPYTPLFGSSARRPMGPKTPLAYSAVPGQPNYRRVNEELPSTRGKAADSTPGPSRVFGGVSGSPNIAPGSSEPSVRSVGRTFAVPDDTDDSMDTDDSPKTEVVTPRPIGNTFYGLPDDFYDNSSDSDEDVMEDATPPPAPHPAPAELPIAPLGAAPPAGSAATPFTHKYTPAKPSGLRAVQTHSSSPAVITPPASPPELDALLARMYAQNHLELVPPRNVFDHSILPDVNSMDLEKTMLTAYGTMLKPIPGGMVS